MILVTGGAGFIGSNFIRQWLNSKNEPIVNLDALTYSGNLLNLACCEQHELYSFVLGDINDRVLVENLFADSKPRAVVHFAAESHVDRSISEPASFLLTNIMGTQNLLEVATKYWQELSEPEKSDFRFVHISTDEVYGSLSNEAAPFTETHRYRPNSPYSASKAASDHLVRAWNKTYGLPTLITNCSNNFGPYQFPEKLIPLVILNALEDKPIPVYGDGKNIRDWLYVNDHCTAIDMVLEKGVPGETYNIGGNHECTNIEIVRNICQLLDELRPSASGSYDRLITYVKDRPGHDHRYAIDNSKIQTSLGWKPEETFVSGLRKTVDWYLNNLEWIDQVKLKTS